MHTEASADPQGQTAPSKALRKTSQTHQTTAVMITQTQTRPHRVRVHDHRVQPLHADGGRRRVRARWLAALRRDAWQVCGASIVEEILARHFKAGTGAEAVRQGQECHEDEECVPQWRGPD